MSSDGENRCLDARRVQTPSESYELLNVVRSHIFLMQLIKHFFFFFFENGGKHEERYSCAGVRAR